MATEETVKLSDLIEQFEKAKSDEQDAQGKLEAAQQERERLSRLIAAELQISTGPQPSRAARTGRRATGDGTAPTASGEAKEKVLSVLGSDGMDNATIAEKSGLSPATVRNAVKALMADDRVSEDDAPKRPGQRGRSKKLYSRA